MTMPSFVFAGPEASAHLRIVPQAFDLDDLKTVAHRVMQDKFGMHCYHDYHCFGRCFTRLTNPAAGIRGIGGHKIAQCLNECCR